MSSPNDQEALQILRQFPTAYITDGLSRLGIHGGWLTGLVPRGAVGAGSFVGKVMTIQWAPRQHRGQTPLTTYGVMRQRRDETILVMAGGLWGYYLMGDNNATAARVAGFEAILVDGCVRDAAGLRETGMGVFSTGLEGGHPTMLEVVAHNVPVMFRGEWVQPGDIIAVDGDGAVVFPAAVLADVVVHAQRIAELEVKQREAILNQAPLEDLYAILHTKHGES